MAKSKKKRSKVYTGADAKITRPQVVRISAENRSAPKQWLYEHRQFRRPILIALAIAVALLLVVLGIVSLLGGNA